MNSREAGSPIPEKEEGKKFYRITPEQFDSLPDGTKLTLVTYKDSKYEENSEVKIKGVDIIDKNDIRSGFMPFGFYKEDVPEGFKVDERGISNIDKTDGDNE